ncbi:MAG: hypothetical protein J0H68_03475 [Sphingobacteriia bacterium]|nr:hypothetical protein [Sphingobacteriia bacterium]
MKQMYQKFSSIKDQYNKLQKFMTDNHLLSVKELTKTKIKLNPIDKNEYTLFEALEKLNNDIENAYSELQTNINALVKEINSGAFEDKRIKKLDSEIAEMGKFFDEVMKGEEAIKNLYDSVREVITSKQGYKNGASNKSNKKLSEVSEKSLLNPLNIISKIVGFLKSAIKSFTEALDPMTNINRMRKDSQKYHNVQNKLLKLKGKFWEQQSITIESGVSFRRNKESWEEKMQSEKKAIESSPASRKM